MNKNGRLFTEAWIETVQMVAQGNLVVGRLFTEAWIETLKLQSPICDNLSPLHGGVD